ncbi:hypothetical protein LTR50_005770 [Elasticomyces elasticus]|nr:hypothetical protein LTR50_005770 [Elasticomyces elasticus]
MGWFWGSSNPQPSDDAYSKLDPALREFLDKESPLKYTPPKPSNNALPPSQDNAPNTYRSQLGLGETETSNHDRTEKPAVPSESLFQDGRYAHLWKTYTPQAEIDAAGRTDQDRLTDVVDAYNERKAQISRAAIENCVFEQMAEKDCFVRGGWHARTTMCRAENKVFNRCYLMQSRFLKALGYLGMQRTEAEEERIQMHADKLYQEMMERERLSEEAKKAGLPEPTFEPLLNPQSASEAASAFSGTEAVPTATQATQARGLDIFGPEKRKEIEARLAGKSVQERELEVQLIVAESRASVEYGEKIREHFDAEKKQRGERMERGKGTVGDTIKRIWGWD